MDSGEDTPESGFLLKKILLDLNPSLLNEMHAAAPEGRPGGGPVTILRFL